LVNAEIIGRYLQSTFGVSANSIQAIPNITHPNPVDYLSETESLTYEALKSQNKKLAIIVANLKPIKGIDDIFAAISALDRTDTHFCFIGNDQDGLYEEKARQLSIHSNCTFLGSRSNVSAHLDRADFAILPSRSEGLSNSLIEYLFAELPVIATRVGGNPEVLDQGKFGTLVPSQDPQAMCTAINDLLSDLENRKANATIACQAVKELYKPETILAQYKAFYLSQLERV
jgi:glycosyltransferase involved in cell wall biosynthesis